MLWPSEMCQSSSSDCVIIELTIANNRSTSQKQFCIQFVRESMHVFVLVLKQIRQKKMGLCNKKQAL